MHSGYVDLHHHLLYGMDDGPPTPAQTAQLLQQAVAQGVTHIVSTPHVQPGIHDLDFDLYNKHLSATRTYIRENGLNLTIIPGSEVRYTSATTDHLRCGRILPLGNSWNILLEFHPLESYDTIRRAIDAVNNTGFSVVLAHAERYRALRWGNRLARLRKDCHIRIQINCDTILRSHQSWDDLWIRYILKQTLVDVVASDAHDVRQRPCSLGNCAQLIRRIYGPQIAQRLCITTPMSLLHGRETNNE